MISTCRRCRIWTRGAGSTFQSFEGFRVSRSLKPWNSATLKLCRSFTARNGMAFRLGSTTHRFLSARRSGRQKIEKRTCFGGPCFEGTLQKPTGVSESSPVAGTIENSAFSENLRCRADTRDSNKLRPAATHLLSVNCLYQMNPKNCKGQFEKCVSLPKWSPETREIWAVVTSVTAFKAGSRRR